MSELEKAQALLANRNYSHDSKKLETVAWISVHKLAQMYDRMRSLTMTVEQKDM